MKLKRKLLTKNEILLLKGGWHEFYVKGYIDGTAVFEGVTNAYLMERTGKYAKKYGSFALISFPSIENMAEFDDHCIQSNGMLVNDSAEVIYVVELFNI